MAKVISKGVFQKMHKVCGSVIEFSVEELKEDYISDYLGDKDYFRYLICPACLEKMYFPQYGSLK